MVEIPEPFRSEILEYGKILTPDIVSFENNPHITIRWGLETNDAEEVADAIGAFIPIRIMFGATKMFMASDQRPTDVVFIEAFGESLRRMQWKVDRLPHEKSFLTYLPHVTVGFTNPGSAMGYVGTNPVVGKKCAVEEVVFCPAAGPKKLITRWGHVMDYERIHSGDYRIDASEARSEGEQPARSAKNGG